MIEEITIEETSDVTKSSEIETSNSGKKSIFVTPNLRRYYGVESITEYRKTIEEFCD